MTAAIEVFPTLNAGSEPTNWILYWEKVVEGGGRPVPAIQTGTLTFITQEQARRFVDATGLSRQETVRSISLFQVAASFGDVSAAPINFA